MKALPGMGTTIDVIDPHQRHTQRRRDHPRRWSRGTNRDSNQRLTAASTAEGAQGQGKEKLNEVD